MYNKLMLSTLCFEKMNSQLFMKVYYSVVYTDRVTIVLVATSALAESFQAYVGNSYSSLTTEGDTIYRP